MFRRLRVQKTPQKFGPDLESISVNQLIGDASFPISIKAVNSLPENPKLRLYRMLLPIQILTEFDINPRSWKNPDSLTQVKLVAENGGGKIQISAWCGEDPKDEFFYLELADNAYNGIDLHFLVINDPRSEKFNTDFDEEGRDTLFGTVHRNTAEEIRAMQAGLAPGQIRKGLGGSRSVFTHIESFLTLLAHHAIFLEPLTYVSAWVFERRGFAYVQGHRLMETIHKEFQPGGELHEALDGSTPFRQPDQWLSVRGRAWAIHDGILDVIGEKWDELRMVKQVGRNAGVNTFPDGVY
jgi:hypothetical protein